MVRASNDAVFQISHPDAHSLSVQQLNTTNIREDQECCIGGCMQQVRSLTLLQCLIRWTGCDIYEQHIGNPEPEAVERSLIAHVSLLPFWSMR